MYIIVTGVKMCLDEVDVSVSLTEHLFRVFGLSEKWQERNLQIGKREDPKLSVSDSNPWYDIGRLLRTESVASEYPSAYF